MPEPHTRGTKEARTERTAAARRVTFQWKKSRFVLECIHDDNRAMRNPRSLVLAFSSLLLSLSLSLSSSLSFSLTRESAWINNAYPRARTREKSTAMVARGASPRTPAIAHTYLYTVIFKMKERRAGSRVVVVERALARSLGRGKKDRVCVCTNHGDQSHIFAGSVRPLRPGGGRRRVDDARRHNSLAAQSRPQRRRRRRRCMSSIVVEYRPREFDNYSTSSHTAGRSPRALTCRLVTDAFPRGGTELCCYCCSFSVGKSRRRAWLARRARSRCDV